MKAIIAIIFTILTTYVIAEDVTTKESKTKLPTFESNAGKVSVNGYTQIGLVANQGRWTTITCQELTEATSGKKSSGLTVTLSDGRGGSTRSQDFYVSYAEIDSIVKGIDYITKIDKSATKLDMFQAKYSTSNDLSILTLGGSDGIVQAEIDGGSISVPLSIEKLVKVKTMLQKAKDILDSIKQ